MWLGIVKMQIRCRQKALNDELKPPEQTPLVTNQSWCESVFYNELQGH